jgi:hypothetical protein
LIALFVSVFALPAAADPPAGTAAARDVVDLGAGAPPLTVPMVPDGYVVVQRGPVTIAYARSIEGQVRGTLARVERDVRGLASQLGLDDVPALEVRLVPDPEALRRLAPAELPPPTYAVGVAYPSLRLALVSASAPATWEAADVPRVLRHELSHLLLAEATGHAPVPRWFTEGVAVYQSAERSFDRFRALAMASFTGGLLPLSRLDDGFASGPDQVNVAYAQSADFVDYLTRTLGNGRFRVFLDHVRSGRDLDGALRDTSGRSLAAVEYDWQHDMRLRFLTAPLWAGGGLLWFTGAALLIAAMVRRRRKSRETLARWEREEAALDALHIAVVAPGAALRTEPGPRDAPPSADVPAAHSPELGALDEELERDGLPRINARPGRDTLH